MIIDLPTAVDSNRPRSNRKWRRFGLRSLFVVVTLIACVSAWLGVQIRRCHDEALAMVQLSVPIYGRNVQFLFGNLYHPNPRDHDDADPGLRPPFFRGGPVWLTSLFGVDIYQTVISFSCYPKGNVFVQDRDGAGRTIVHATYVSGLTDNEMQWVAKLKNLLSLRLEASNISDDGLAQLSGLHQLETLTLGNTQITDRGIPTLLNFRELRRLGLDGLPISDSSVDVLVKCTRLQKLDVGSTQLTADGIARLRERLPNCKIEQ